MFKQSRKRFAESVKSRQNVRSSAESCSDDSDIEDELPLKDPKLKRRLTKVSTMERGLLSSLASTQKSSSVNVSKKGSLNAENIKAVMSMLGIDFEKTVETKRKKIEKYADDAIEKHQTRLSKFLKSKDEANIQHLDKLKDKLSEALKQGEKDLHTNKEQEARAVKLFDQQINLIQNAMEQEKKRIEALRHLHKVFTKALQEMESNMKSDTKTLNFELHKDVERIQKILNKDNTCQALTNATKSLFALN